MTCKDCAGTYEVCRYFGENGFCSFGRRGNQNVYTRRNGTGVQEWL